MKYVPPINGDTGNPNRSYVNANPSGGIQGSIPPAAAFENVQRELIAVITAAGLTPTDADLTQLLAAINFLISAGSAPDASTTVKGKIEIATDAEALGGTDTIRAVTSANLASSKSLGANGYYKFPGGLIIQWGNTSGLTQTFPIAFPTACFQVMLTDKSIPANANAITATSTTSFTFVGDGTACFFAIGN